ncbi:MAG: ATP-dependent RNA helicase, partial [Acidimicrobiales bacterium]
PGLSGYGTVIFDEFHERSIHADTALAFVRETTDALRDDLRVIVMSATFDAASLATRLQTDAIVTAEAPLHPVEIRYEPPLPGLTVDQAVVPTVIELLKRTADQTGDILVFMAGAGAINRAERDLVRKVGNDVAITALHGSLPPEAQDQALQLDPNGRRKVILSTPIAETSVTIDGVRTVVDTGRRRRPEIDHGRGMSRLRTTTASQAACDQRAGRAGRQGPGVCIRLWTAGEHEHRPANEPPEILTSDLTSLALQIAAWGARQPSELPWLDAPPTIAMNAARAVLIDLGAIDNDGQMTNHGKAMHELGTEPRLAHLLLRAKSLEIEGRFGALATGCAVAAALADRDLLRGRDRPTDLRARVEQLGGRPGSRGRSTAGVDDGAVHQARAMAKRWNDRLGTDLTAPRGEIDLDIVGLVASFAFPERLAQRRADTGSFLLASGAGVSTSPNDGLARERWLAVAETEGTGGAAQIRMAAPITIEETQNRLGAIVVSRSPLSDPDRSSVIEALLAGVQREGLSLLSWDRADERYRSRLAFLHSIDEDEWPAVDDNSLLEQLDTWLTPALGNAKRRSDVEKIKPREALANLIDWRHSRDLDRLAPTHIDVPSGSRLPVNYDSQGGPALPVRLQEVFGLDQSPTVANGQVPITLELLSPAHRPVQITSDLAGFWATGYAEVRKEMRGRYPKHHWPEDPMSAAATSRTKRRS